MLYQIQHKIYIKMSSNKSSTGSETFEIPIVILRKYRQFPTFALSPCSQRSV